MVEFLDVGAMQFGMKVELLFSIHRYLESKVEAAVPSPLQSKNLMLSLVVNTFTNRVVKILGKDEVVRWLNLSLYQGAPAKGGFTTMVCISSQHTSNNLSELLTLT